jgi:uncharacterized protein
MKSISSWGLVFMLVPVILLSACRSFTPPVRYYTISSITLPAAGAGVIGKRAVTIGILPVELPGYIDRTQMVRRDGPNRLDVSSLHRWAGYPDKLVQQVIEDDLQALMPHARIVNVPSAAGLKPDVTVAFRFLELIGTVDRKMLLSAVWDIGERNAPAALQSHRIRIVQPIKNASFSALAAAHSRVLATLCRRVAESLQAYQGAGKK